MANAARDDNNVPTLLATLNSDGTTSIRVKVTPTTHYLKISDGTTGSDNGPTNALRDQNSVPVLMAISSADGVTPVPVYTDSDGNLLIKTT